MKNIFKTLYIHGLDSSPKKNKINIIKKNSTDYSFHLDYRNEPNTFKILSNCIKENNIYKICIGMRRFIAGLELGIEEFEIKVLPNDSVDLLIKEKQQYRHTNVQ